MADLPSTCHHGCRWCETTERILVAGSVLDTAGRPDLADTLTEVGDLAGRKDPLGAALARAFLGAPGPAPAAAAEHGHRDGMIAWLHGVAWTSGQEVGRLPAAVVDDVAALVRRTIEAIADALIAREHGEHAAARAGATRAVCADGEHLRLLAAQHPTPWTVEHSPEWTVMLLDADGREVELDDIAQGIAAAVNTAPTTAL